MQTESLMSLSCAQKYTISIYVFYMIKEVQIIYFITAVEINVHNFQLQ